jgi:hypothetical protein
MASTCSKRASEQEKIGPKPTKHRLSKIKKMHSGDKRPTPDYFFNGLLELKAFEIALFQSRYVLL